MARLALFIALSEEMGYAIEEMEKFGRFLGQEPNSQLEKGQTTFQFELKKFSQPENRIEVHLIKGMGNILSAAHVGTAFGRLGSVRLALLVGISGALDVGSVGLGDVVISNSVKYYTPDKIYHADDREKDLLPITREMRALHIQNGGRSPLPLPAPDKALAFDDRDIVHGNNVLRFLRDQVFHADHDNVGHIFVDDMTRSSKPPAYTLKSGTLLGSNWVIDSGTYSDYIKQKNEWVDFDYYYLNDRAEYHARCKWDKDVICAVDMESYGFFKAVAEFSKRVTNVKAYAVRGISDLCAGKSEEDKKHGNQNRRIATQNSTNAALSLIEYYLDSRSRSFNIP